MTIEELLAVFIAREMRDFETCACGARSFIPAAGIAAVGTIIPLSTLGIFTIWHNRGSWISSSSEASR
jgi:hypothetical protein